MLENTTQTGQGVVEWGDTRVDASYGFDVRASGRRPHGQGRLIAKNSLDGALHRDSVHLVLTNGTWMAIRLTAGMGTQWFFRLQAPEEV